MSHRSPKSLIRRRASSLHATRPILAITMGDPAGIGPEIIAKALAIQAVWRVCRPLVIGSIDVMQRTLEQLHLPVKVLPLSSPPEPDESSWSRSKILLLDPLGQPLGPFRQGKAQAGPGAASVAYIRTAVQLAQQGQVAAIVTAPINKKALHLAGYDYPGHTELLAALTHTKTAGMMLVGGPLKIVFATTHVALSALPTLLTQARVLRTIYLAHMALQKLFRVAAPRIGVAALNPHAGEDGLFGQEERRVIAPAVRKAQRAGISASGPWPADTLFGAAVRGQFDGLVAMYHDQGLIPLKTVAFGRSVNVTVGLPFIRTSVDHGTAYDIVGQGTADPQSLLEAIRLAATLATRA
ncbi:MAG: 4-hydroxythreonine-4-phosphate dehydrogenase PdxA [Nitrospirae bacterium]|nr:MAG: 4-hydroxythreonine-4-phosphate dehydrogenase PdxA [Nitrospirota bacterium]